MQHSSHRHDSNPFLLPHLPAARRHQQKLEKSALIGGFLQKLQPNEIAPAVLLLLGRIFSATDSRTLNISWRTLQKLNEQTAKSKKSPPSILEVHQRFAEIAGASGKGSRQRKNYLPICSPEFRQLRRNISSK
jgi:hypothetical protein